MLLNGFQLPNNKFLEFAPIKAEANVPKASNNTDTVKRFLQSVVAYETLINSSLQTFVNQHAHRPNSSIHVDEL